VPAQQPPPPPRPVPRTVRIAALLVAVEGAALVVLAVVEALSTVLGDPGSVGLALATAAMAAAGGVLLLWLAAAMSRLRKAARSPVVVLQLISLPIGWTLAVDNGRPELGLPVLALAVAVLVLLGTSGARDALTRG
jgi:hypothetical protein